MSRKVPYNVTALDLRVPVGGRHHVTLRGGSRVVGRDQRRHDVGHVHERAASWHRASAKGGARLRYSPGEHSVVWLRTFAPPILSVLFVSVPCELNLHDASGPGGGGAYTRTALAPYASILTSWPAAASWTTKQPSRWEAARQAMTSAGASSIVFGTVERSSPF